MQAFKALVDLMRMRHCGLLEVIDTINGHKLCKFDSDHINVNTNASDKRIRMLRAKADIEVTYCASPGKIVLGVHAFNPRYPVLTSQAKALTF